MFVAAKALAKEVADVFPKGFIQGLQRFMGVYRDVEGLERRVLGIGFRD